MDRPGDRQIPLDKNRQRLRPFLELGRMGMDRATLERLYEEEAEGIFRYALALAGCEGVARDILQEVFVKLARDGLALQSVQDRRSYLLRMARNGFIDRVRRDQSARERGERWGRDFGFVAREDDPDRREFARWIEEGLAALPENQRSVVVLHLWDGLSFTQIGAVCEVSANTAASRYRYGVDKLRERLRPLYEELKG